MSKKGLLIRHEIGKLCALLTKNERYEEMEIIKSQQIEEVEQKISEAEFDVQQLVVEDESSEQKASELLGVLVAKKKRVEAERVHMKSPVLEQGKRIDAFFNQFKDKIILIEKGLRRKLSDYKMEQLRESREAEAERLKIARQEVKDAEEENREVKNIQLPTVPDKPKAIVTSAGKIANKTVWKFEIIEEKKVPKKYMSVDEKKLREAVKKGEREIAGLRIYEDISLMVS